MVVGQANKSDQKDDGAGHEDRRPVRSHLTKHDGQAIPLFSVRAYYLNVEEKMFIQMKGMKGADKDTKKTKPEA